MKGRPHSASREKPNTEIPVSETGPPLIVGPAGSGAALTGGGISLFEPCHGIENLPALSFAHRCMHVGFKFLDAELALRELSTPLECRSGRRTNRPGRY